MQDLLYIVEIAIDDRLSISWDRPAQPNDYTLNYTVSVTDISTDTELSRTVLNETQIINCYIASYSLYGHTYNVQYILYLSFTVRGVPISVTVFATNGRGNGESVSEVVYVEEDGM